MLKNSKQLGYALPMADQPGNFLNQKLTLNRKTVQETIQLSGANSLENLNRKLGIITAI